MQKTKRILLILLYIVLILINTKVYAKTAKAINETVRIRKESSTDSSVVALVSQDEEVEIIEEQGEWYKVNYKTYTGYIRKDMLEVEENDNTSKQEENTTDPSITENSENTTTNNNVQNTTTNEIQENVNEEQNQVNEQNNTTSVENKTNEQNTTENEQTSNIENTKINIQKGQKINLISNIEIKILPTINSSVIGTINANTEVTVIDIINKWCHIENEENSGWVLISKLEAGESEKTENNPTETTEQNQQENNETSENSSQNSSENETTNNETIASSENNGTETNNESNTSLTTKYVSTETLNVRKSPKNDAEIISHVTLNTEVTILENIDESWVKIKAKEVEGYVASKYLSDTKTEISSRSEKIVRESYQEENKPKETVNEDPAVSSSLGQDVVSYAKQYLGYKYVSGGASPQTGFDCSGFTSYVYKHFGITLNRTSTAQNSNGIGISKENLQPGDLLIFNNSSNSAIGHVGIYMGNNNFIHAANGSKGVITTSLSSSYYVTRYVGARRVIN